jgi:hypothetical protein
MLPIEKDTMPANNSIFTLTIRHTLEGVILHHGAEFFTSHRCKAIPVTNGKKLLLRV